MTTPFENFVNTALGKSLSADVTLPTADDIPVFTGIGRQVTGKTIAELGLASKDIVYIPNSTDPFPLTTKTLYMIGDYYVTTTYGDLYLQLPPLTASTIIEVQLAFNIEQVGHVYVIPSGTDLVFGQDTPADLKPIPLAPGCTVKLFFHSVERGWVGQANYSDNFIDPIIHPFNATSWTSVGHRIVSESTGVCNLTIPDGSINLGTLPSVATAYGTLTAGQSRCQIIGGSGNTVGATAVDCILTGCTSVTAYGTRNQFNNCTNWVLNATHAGTDNIFNRCTGELAQTMYVDSIGVTYNNCTQENLYGTPSSYGAQSPWTNYSTVEGSGVGGGVRITKQTATLTGQGAGAKELVASGAHGASFGVLGNNRINSGNKAYHRIQIFGGDSGGNVYRMTADRKVMISQGAIASNSTLDVDIADAGSTYTVTISVATGYLTVTITPNSAQNMNYIATVISEYVG